MSDSELLALLRSIDKHNDRVRAIVDRIAESGRADAAKLGNYLLGSSDFPV